MTKRDIKIAIGAVVVILMIVALVTLIRHQSMTSDAQKLVNSKIELLDSYVPSDWYCISATGGFNKDHMRYEYTFTYMIRGISGHAIYVYSDEKDLTRETVDRLERVNDEGFVYTPEK